MKLLLPIVVASSLFAQNKSNQISYTIETTTGYYQNISIALVYDASIEVYYRNLKDKSSLLKCIKFNFIQVRMYVDSYESDEANQLKDASEMLAPCIDVALQISKLPEFTGRDKPTVIT